MDLDIDSRVFEKYDDQFVFNDLMQAIQYASRQTVLDINTFKTINAHMNSLSYSQPVNPGQFRSNFPVIKGEYIPAPTVSDEDFEQLLSEIHDNCSRSGWELFAKLSKLQPFDNGNKRTALIAANLFIGAWTDPSSKPLLLPTNYKKLRFNANLYDYYLSDDFDDRYMCETEALRQFTDFALLQNEG